MTTVAAAPVGTAPSSDAAATAQPFATDATSPAPGLVVPARLPWIRQAADLAAVGAALGTMWLFGASLPGWLMVAVPVAWWTVRAAGRGYARPIGLPTRCARTASVLRAGSSLAVVMWTALVVAGVSQQREGLVLALAVTAGSVLAQLVVDSLQRDHQVGDAARRVVVAGTYDQVRLVLDELRRTPRNGVDVVGVCLSEAAGQELFDVPTHLGFAELPEAVAAAHADTAIILPTEQLAPRDLQRLGWRLEEGGTDLYLGSGLLDVAVARSTVTNVGGLHLLRIGLGRRHHATRAVKNVWERLAAFTLLVALSPVLFVVALLVRLDSHGPAVFRQRRVGRDGRVFTMLKFRTMCPDLPPEALVAHGNDADGVLFKLRSDPRITRVGRVLRRYSLDELPQLVNVLLGQMALVGPRPALPGEVDQYDHDPRRRLVVRPGLTGLWQVSGRSDLPWDEAVRLDLLYVDNWSLSLDFAILARTAGAVLRHQGAY